MMKVIQLQLTPAQLRIVMHAVNTANAVLVSDHIEDIVGRGFAYGDAIESAGVEQLQTLCSSIVKLADATWTPTVQS